MTYETISSTYNDRSVSNIVDLIEIY